MSRALTAPVLAEIQKQTVSPILLYEGEFDGGNIHLWSGVGNIVWNGNTYIGAGRLLNVTPVEETVEVRAASVQVGLSGLPADLVSLALSSARQGKKGRLWLGLLKADKYLSLPGVAGNYASTPDSVATSIAGSIDIRAKLSAVSWNTGNYQTVLVKEISGQPHMSFALFINSIGGLSLFFSGDGLSSPNANSTVALGFSAGATSWIRVTRDSVSGQVIFYTSNDGVTWTTLGSPLSTVAGSLFDSTQGIAIGFRPISAIQTLAGNVYYAEVRNGINGPIVAKFDPSNDWLTTPLSLTSSTGEIWTVNQSGSTPAEIRTANQEIIADPYQIFTGLLDVPSMDESGDTANIAVSYENRLIGLLTANDRRYTPEDQHVDFPGDTGFDKVAGLQDASIIW